ncbi:MAG: glycosyltransferase family 9 protein [Planctomycetota bacterium]|jgi:ADP-heptose:LPS heptosyltransferase
MQRTLRLLWWLLILRPIDWLAGLGSRRAHDDRVLVVRTDAVGDFVLWSRALLSLRALYPRASHRIILRALYPRASHRIILFGNAGWLPLARALDAADEYIAVDTRRFILNPIYRFRMLRRIRRLGASVAIHPTFARYLLCGDSIVGASGAGERIGSRGDDACVGRRERAIGDAKYTRLLPASKEALSELERNAEFMRELGLPGFRPGLPDISAVVRDVDRPRGDYYVLLPGSYRPKKMWPVERFARVAEYLHRHTPWRGIVCGGPGEKMLGERLLAEADAPIESLAGRTTVLEFAAALARARLAIGNDSGGIHLAAAFGVPAVCILGGAHFGRFFPYPESVGLPGPPPVAVYSRMPCYGCEWRCGLARTKNGPVPCVLGVTEGDVFEALRPRVEQCR